MHTYIACPCIPLHTHAYISELVMSCTRAHATAELLIFFSLNVLFGADVDACENKKE